MPERSGALQESYRSAWLKINAVANGSGHPRQKNKSNGVDARAPDRT